jgi:hypothetical protein
MSHVLKKPFMKVFERCHKLAFYGDQKKIGYHNHHKEIDRIFSIAIQHTPTIGW